MLSYQTPEKKKRDKTPSKLPVPVSKSPTPAIHPSYAAETPQKLLKRLSFLENDDQEKQTQPEFLKTRLSQLSRNQPDTPGFKAALDAKKVSSYIPLTVKSTSTTTKTPGRYATSKRVTAYFDEDFEFEQIDGEGIEQVKLNLYDDKENKQEEKEMDNQFDNTIDLFSDKGRGINIDFENTILHDESIEFSNISKINKEDDDDVFDNLLDFILPDDSKNLPGSIAPLSSTLSPLQNKCSIPSSSTPVSSQNTCSVPSSSPTPVSIQNTCSVPSSSPTPVSSQNTCNATSSSPTPVSSQNTTNIPPSIDPTIPNFTLRNHDSVSYDIDVPSFAPETSMEMMHELNIQPCRSNHNLYKEFNRQEEPMEFTNYAIKFVPDLLKKEKNGEASNLAYVMFRKRLNQVKESRRSTSFEVEDKKDYSKFVAGLEREIEEQTKNDQGLTTKLNDENLRYRAYKDELDVVTEGMGVLAKACTIEKKNLQNIQKTIESIDLTYTPLTLFQTFNRVTGYAILTLFICFIGILIAYLISIQNFINAAYEEDIEEAPKSALIIQLIELGLEEWFGFSYNRRSWI